MARAALHTYDGDGRRLPGSIALAAWLAGLTAAIVVLHAIGHGGLAAPPLSQPGAWSGWLAERDAATAAVAVLRVATLAVAWYLVVTTLLVAVAELTRAGRLVTVADVVAMPVVRRVVHGAFGVGLAASTLAAVTAGAGGSAAGTAPTVADAQMAAAVTSELEPGTATMTRQPDAPPGRATMTRLGPPPAPADATAAPGAVWTAQPGDHLWSIAVETLRAAWGRDGSEAEVAGYWRQVVDANRHQVPDPDLLPVGTIVRLPPVP